MKGSRSSWHGRLYRYVYNTQQGVAYVNPWTKRERRDPPELPANLCPYVWSIFLGLVGCLVLVILVVAFSPLLLLGYAIYWAYRLLENVADARRLRKLTDAPEEKEPEPKEKKPSLVAAYLKAKKDRVCPQIEWVD